MKAGNLKIDQKSKWTCCSFLASSHLSLFVTMTFVRHRAACCLLLLVVSPGSTVSSESSLPISIFLKLCVFYPSCNFFYVYTHSFIHRKLFYQTDNSKCFLTLGGPCCLFALECANLIRHYMTSVCQSWLDTSTYKCWRHDLVRQSCKCKWALTWCTDSQWECRQWSSQEPPLIPRLSRKAYCINSPACYILRTDVQSSAFSLACTDHLSEKSRDCHGLTNTTVCVTDEGTIW